MKATYSNHNGIATIIILAGVVLLARNLDLIPAEIRHHLFSWPGIIIFVGAAALVTKSNRIPGLVLITTGVFFLLPKVLDIHWLDLTIYWPMILIVVGLVLITGVPFSNSQQEKEESK